MVEVFDADRVLALRRKDVAAVVLAPRWLEERGRLIRHPDHDDDPRLDLEIGRLVHWPVMRRLP